jgi:1-acyl-sn-glycerol-3-phosphate acyltransferase
MPKNQPQQQPEGPPSATTKAWWFFCSVLHALWCLFWVIPTAFWMMFAALVPGLSSGTQMFAYAKFFLTRAMHGVRGLCGIHWQVQGMENLPNGPAILLVKHQSTLETFLMPLLMPRDLAYVFKKELLYVPFFGWGIARCDMIHIDRSRRTEAFSKVVEQGQRLLDKGVWVIMFPEGTRIPRGQAGTYKTGGARLAVATNTPVIPIAVNSATVWPRKAFIKRPGLVTVSIGQPIAPNGKSADDLMAEVQAWIEGEMRRLDPVAYPDAPRIAA